MKNWEITLAKNSGFCFGVQNAVTTAYSILKENPGEKICMLGEITHNETVVGDLLDKGMVLVHEPEEVEDKPAGSSGAVKDEEIIETKHSAFR